MSEVFEIFLYIFAGIGALVVLLWVLRLLPFFLRHCLRRKQNLYGKYGREGSWALVTGGSDGIGLEFCRQLAQMGFNICMVARNEQKMNQKLQEMLQNCSASIKTRTIVADFNSMASIDEYEKAISERVQDLDLGVIICNAGWNIKGPFQDYSNSEVQDIIKANGLQGIYLTKALMENILSRDKKTGLILVGSQLGTFPCPGTLPYCASKALLSYFGQGLAFELRGKCDVLVYEPGLVASAFARGSQVTCTNISPAKAAECALRDLGKELVTTGAFIHGFQAAALKILPLGMKQRIMFKKFRSQMSEHRVWAEEKTN